MPSTLSAIASAFNRTPVPFSSRTQRAMPGLGAADHSKTAQLRAMENLGTVFSIVDLTSTAVAKATWRLHRKAPRQEDGIGAEIQRHAALMLLNKPNPFQTRSEFMQATQQHRDLTGEAWWVVARDERSSIPLELWLLRPDRIVPVPDPEDFIRGYVYKGPDGQDIPLEVDEVIRILTPNPVNPYRGLGPVQSMLTDIDSSVQAAEWQRNFFENSAQPGGIIETAERLSDDEFDDLRDRWNEQHRGVSAAHRVAILEQSKWVNTQFSMRDMEFSSLRNVPRELIREAFHVPKSMLGTAEDVNRANAEAGETQFARWTTTPRLEALKQALNEQLLPMFGSAGNDVKFVFDDPTPEDVAEANATKTAQANSFKTLIDAGVKPEDAAETVGLPPLEMAPKPKPPPALAPTQGQDRATESDQEEADDEPSNALSAICTEPCCLVPDQQSF